MQSLNALLGGTVIPKQQLITEDTIWHRPEKMVGDTVWLTMIGGGESGSSGTPPGPRGGYGGQFVIDMPVDLGELETVPCTVGNGGEPPSAGSANTPGGPTSFGSLLTVLGGSRSTGTGAPGAYINSSSEGPTLAQNGKDTPLGLGGKYTGYIGASSTVAGGGGGLVLDTSGVGGSGSHQLMTSAQGYGAGGGHRSGTGYAGAPGAILVKWLEYI